MRARASSTVRSTKRSFRRTAGSVTSTRASRSMSVSRSTNRGNHSSQNTRKHSFTARATLSSITSGSAITTAASLKALFRCRCASMARSANANARGWKSSWTPCRVRIVKASASVRRPAPSKSTALVSPRRVRSQSPRPKNFSKGSRSPTHSRRLRKMHSRRSAAGWASC